MRRGEIFWGSLLVVLVYYFFLRTAGYLTGDVFEWFWPFVVIAIGIWILVDGFATRVDFKIAEKISIPLQGAKEARLEINHGMGQIELHQARTGEIF